MIKIHIYGYTLMKMMEGISSQMLVQNTSHSMGAVQFCIPFVRDAKEIILSFCYLTFIWSRNECSSSDSKCDIINNFKIIRYFKTSWRCSGSFVSEPGDNQILNGQNKLKLISSKSELIFVHWSFLVLCIYCITFIIWGFSLVHGYY